MKVFSSSAAPDRRLDDHAQHVLVVVEIDARLSADGGIDLGQQGGRDIGIPHPALVDGRREAREVRGDSAADGQYQRLPRRPGLQQRTGDEEHRLHRFFLFRRVDGNTSPHPGNGRDHLRRNPCGILVIDDEHLRLLRDERRDIGYPVTPDHPAGDLPVDGDVNLLSHKKTKIREKFCISPNLG